MSEEGEILCRKGHQLTRIDEQPLALVRCAHCKEKLLVERDDNDGGGSDDGRGPPSFIYGCLECSYFLCWSCGIRYVFRYSYVHPHPNHPTLGFITNSMFYNDTGGECSMDFLCEDLPAAQATQSDREMTCQHVARALHLAIRDGDTEDYNDLDADEELDEFLSAISFDKEEWRTAFRSVYPKPKRKKHLLKWLKDHLAVIDDSKELDDDVKELHVTQDRFRRCLDLLKQCHEDLGDLQQKFLSKWNGSVDRNLQRTQRSIEDQMEKLYLLRNPSLFVFGTASSGKSSVINLMLDEHLMPMGASAGVTRGMCRVSHSWDKRAMKVLPSRPDDIQSLEIEKADSRDPCDALRGFLGEKDHSVQFNIEWPIPLLQQGLTILDSPGVSDKKSFDQRVLREMRRAVVCVIVVSAAAGGITLPMQELVRSFLGLGDKEANDDEAKNSEPGAALSEFIDEDSFETREKKLRAKHLFFIVTKMDTIKKVQERAEVRGTIQNQLKLWEIDCGTNYVEVNAKSALECTRYGLKSSTQTQLRSRISKFLSQTFEQDLYRVWGDILNATTTIQTTLNATICMNLKNTVEAKEFHTTQRNFIDSSLSEFQAFRDALKVYRNDLANDVVGEIKAYVEANRKTLLTSLAKKMKLSQPENEVMQGILFELFEDKHLLEHYEKASEKFCAKAQEGFQQAVEQLKSFADNFGEEGQTRQHDEEEGVTPKLRRKKLLKPAAMVGGFVPLIAVGTGVAISTATGFVGTVVGITIAATGFAGVAIGGAMLLVAGAYWGKRRYVRRRVHKMLKELCTVGSHLHEVTKEALFEKLQTRVDAIQARLLHNFETMSNMLDDLEARCDMSDADMAYLEGLRRDACVLIDEMYEKPEFAKFAGDDIAERESHGSATAAERERPSSSPGLSLPVVFMDGDESESKHDGLQSLNEKNLELLDAFQSSVGSKTNLLLSPSSNRSSHSHRSRSPTNSVSSRRKSGGRWSGKRQPGQQPKRRLSELSDKPARTAEELEAQLNAFRLVPLLNNDDDDDGDFSDSFVTDDEEEQLQEAYNAEFLHVGADSLRSEGHVRDEE